MTNEKHLIQLSLLNQQSEDNVELNISNHSILTVASTDVYGNQESVWELDAEIYSIF